MNLPVSVVIGRQTEIPPGDLPPLWMILEDNPIRSCAPCPAVVTLKDDPHAIFTKHWQFYYRAINYNIPLRYIPPNYGTALALFNGTGFPGRHDYITPADIDQKDPNTDKVRSFVRNVLTGTPRYNLTQALKDGAALIRDIAARRISAVEMRGNFAALLTTNVLNVLTFDSRQPPPLKTGRTYPEIVEEIDIDDYEITPRTHRWRFAVENIVNKSGEVKPFDHGAVYDWTGDNAYYTFFPVISNHGWGDVLYPLSKLIKLPDGARPPIPYRYTS